MTERNVSPARLEAISDAVIAVIITIMVLELRPPQAATVPALLRLWPQFAIYFVSFLVVATLWVNHRYLFSLMRRVDERVLWNNMALLFMLSLIPFSTAFVGQTRLAALSIALYALVLFLTGVAFSSLAFGINAQYEPGDQPAAFALRQRLIHMAAVAAYVMAIPLAFLSALAALGLIVAPSLMYVTRLTRPN